MLLLLKPSNTLSFVGTRGSGRAPRAGVFASAPRAGVTTPAPRLVVNASRPRGTVR